MRSTLRRWLPWLFRADRPVPPEAPIRLAPAPRYGQVEPLVSFPPRVRDLQRRLLADDLIPEIPEDVFQLCLCGHWDPKHIRSVGRCTHPGCGCLILRPRGDSPD